MKKISRKIFVLAITIGLILQGTNAGAQTIKEAKSICKNPAKVFFSFNNVQRTKLTIPEPYLYDPYNSYHRKKDPTDFVSLQFNKDNYGPNCGEKEIDKNFYKVTIRSTFPGYLEKMLQSRLRVHKKDMGTENKEFQVFSSEFTEDKPWERHDILVPLNDTARQNFFLECSYSLPSKTPTIRTGCIVTSNLNDTLYLKYVIRPSELNDYIKIDHEIKEKVSNFIAK